MLNTDRFRRRHKYHAKPVIRDGVRYASTAEADWVSVRLFELRIGQFREVRLQPRYQLGDITYRADVELVTNDGRMFAEEVKGVETERFRLVRRLWKKYGPCPLRIIKRRRSRRWQVEEIPGGRS